MAGTRAVRPGPRFRPKKWLGQHFLIDTKVIKRIVSRAGFHSSDMILEVGPGQGALTMPLARSVGHVFAVEKDPCLTSLLREKLSRAGISNVTLFNHDILSFDIHENLAPHQEKIQVIGNLPYNISTPFLERLIEYSDLIDRAVLMFQLEVAKRITASPGGKTYGMLTLLVKYYARPKVLFEVPKQAFYPRPKVGSMVIELDFGRPSPEKAMDEKDFRELVRGAFAHRRKMLLNSLSGFCPSFNRERLLRGMKECHIDPRRRAETLDMQDFLNLANFLTLTKKRCDDKK